jgi:hypothetical protein
VSDTARVVEMDTGEAIGEVVVRYGRQFVDPTKWIVYLVSGMNDMSLRRFEDLASAALYADEVAEALGTIAVQDGEKK